MNVVYNSNLSRKRSIGIIWTVVSPCTYVIYLIVVCVFANILSLSHSLFLPFLLFTSFCFFLLLWCALCACAYNAKYHRDAIHLIRLFIIPSSVYLFFNLECFTSMGPTTGLNEKLSAQNINFNYNIFVFFFIHHLYLVCINEGRKKEREREKEWEL